MTTLHLTINMDGDALSDHLAALDSHPGMAVAVATDVPNHVTLLSTGGIKDVNGNTVGSWSFVDDDSGDSICPDGPDGAHTVLNSSDACVWCGDVIDVT